MNIAVVDDERVIRDQICGLIKKQKPTCRIDAYSSGEEIIASEKRFDVVFS